MGLDSRAIKSILRVLSFESLIILKESLQGTLEEEKMIDEDEKRNPTEGMIHESEDIETITMTLEVRENLPLLPDVL